MTEINGDRCTVEVEGGWIIKTLKVNINAVGETTSLSLRPERVIVNPSEGSLENVFDGKVKELIYLGDHIRTRVNVCGNDEFIVKVPNSHGHLIMDKDQHIRLGWSSDDCHALDALD